ncbi:hypothetical protein M3231_18745 [Neobacillus mesonae]|nr:hypothetical protein [Neobacillus mesonae]
MKYILKLNIMSALYALLLFYLIESLVNFYRIARITGLEMETVDQAIGWGGLGISLLSSALFCYLNVKWLRLRKANFWTVLLWAPYFVLFIYLFAKLFPMANPADHPGPATGLIGLGMLLFYPVYIALLNFFSYVFQGEES